MLMKQSRNACTRARATRSPRQTRCMGVRFSIVLPARRVFLLFFFNAIVLFVHMCFCVERRELACVWFIFIFIVLPLIAPKRPLHIIDTLEPAVVVVVVAGFLYYIIHMYSHDSPHSARRLYGVVFLCLLFWNWVFVPLVFYLLRACVALCTSIYSISYVH